MKNVIGRRGGSKLEDSKGNSWSIEVGDIILREK